MSEIITTYKLDNLDQSMPMNRDEFYDAQLKLHKQGKKPVQAAAIAQVLLFTPDKEIILQKRSMNKRHNPGLIDKAMGGHIQFGDSPTYTVMVEVLQELSVPSIVLPTQEDFIKTYNLLENYLNSLAIIQFIDSRTVNSKKIFNGEEVLVGNKYYLYFGVYGGSIKPADKEATGVLFYKYDNFGKEITSNPEIHADDLKFFLDKYDKKMWEFLGRI